MTRNQWLILIIALVAFLIWRLVGAFLMFRLSDRTGKKRKTRLGYFVLCFFFGLPAYLYVASLPDWQVLFHLRKIWWVINSDTSENGSRTSPRLKFSTWIPETPKKDKSAEVHRFLTGKKIKDFRCERMVIVSEVPTNECYLCERIKGPFKLCRIIRKDSYTDTPLCTECINAFIEYNPDSVFDLDKLEP